MESNVERDVTQTSRSEHLRATSVSDHVSMPTTLRKDHIGVDVRDEVGDRLFVQVNRTFAFFDLCGFTTYTDVAGHDEAVAVLSQFRTETRRACWAHNVRIVKWLGDGVMLAASAPRAVVVAALELDVSMTTLGSPLLMRGGAARGDVVLFEDDDYVGRAVNFAARLSDCAAPGTVLVPADLAELAPAWAEARPLPTRSVPGFGPRQLVALRGRSSRASPTSRP